MYNLKYADSTNSKAFIYYKNIGNILAIIGLVI